MVKTRLIACLLWRDGAIVQSVGFKHTNIIGNAITAVDFFNVWGIDEIVLLDVSRDKSRREKFYETVENLSAKCFVPLTVGGWIESIDEIKYLLKRGADKVAINTEAMRNPDFVRQSSQTFGNQCIVVSIDAKRVEGGHEVYINRGNETTGTTVTEWADKASKLGAGEIFLTSIDQDGSQEGYDIELIKKVNKEAPIPIVASGGAGEWHHLVEAVEDGGADAVSVANIFHHTQHSTKKAKDYMKEAGLNVREPAFADRYNF